MLRLRLSEARGRTQEGRIALLRSNYGLAREHLQEAIRLLDSFKASDQRQLPGTESAKVDQARQLLDDSLALAPGAPAAPATPASGARPEDQAEGKALTAANLLGEVYRATPEP